MIEQVILTAFKYENSLPPVKQRTTTGWWPHYDKDYKDEPSEVHGSIECWEWFIKLQITPVERQIISSYCSTGVKVSDEIAHKKCLLASRSKYNEILNRVENEQPHLVKKLYGLYTL